MYLLTNRKLIPSSAKFAGGQCLKQSINNQPAAEDNEKPDNHVDKNTLCQGDSFFIAAGNKKEKTGYQKQNRCGRNSQIKTYKISYITGQLPEMANIAIIRTRNYGTGDETGVNVIYD
jgi:hypothetical protein